MSATIDIKVGNAVWKTVPVTKDAVHEREMMKSNFIRLSWYDTVSEEIPVGAYIEYGGVKFILFDPYQPTGEGNRKFKYTPEFQHPIMWLSRIPFTYAPDGVKKYDWVYTGYAGVFATYLVDAINRLSEEDDLFGSLFGRGWTAAVDSSLAATASVSFSSVDILSGASSIAKAFDCEFHFDFENSQFRLGKHGDKFSMMAETSAYHDSPIVLETGVNVNPPSITRSNESYFNAYAVFGSTKNLYKEAPSGGNVQVTERLTLNEDTYPDSILYLSPEGTIIEDEKEGELVVKTARERFEEYGVPQLTKQLILEDVFPKMNCYVYNVRERVCVRKKDDEAIDRTNLDQYERYSKWYLRLAYYDTNPVDNVGSFMEDGEVYYWHDYKFKDDVFAGGTQPGYIFSFLTGTRGYTFSNTAIGELVIPSNQQGHNVQGYITDMPWTDGMFTECANLVIREPIHRKVRMQQYWSDAINPSKSYHRSSDVVDQQRSPLPDYGEQVLFYEDEDVETHEYEDPVIITNETSKYYVYDSYHTTVTYRTYTLKVFNVRVRFPDGSIRQAYAGTKRFLAPTSNGNNVMLFDESSTLWPQLAEGDLVHIIDGVDSTKVDDKHKDSALIKDKALSLVFQPNQELGALSSPLAGRDFELHYYTETLKEAEWSEEDVVEKEDALLAQEGDYRIIFKEENNFIIPTTSENGLVPNPHGVGFDNSVPYKTNNIITLFNIALPDEFKVAAQSELEEEARRAILEEQVDHSNYEFDINLVVGELSLEIGKRVIYRHGGVEMNTCVRKLESRLDGRSVKVTVGSPKVMGTISALKEQVESVAAGFTAMAGGGSLLTEAQFEQMLLAYGSNIFLRKTVDDTTEFDLGMKSAKVDESLDVGDTATVDRIEGHRGHVMVASNTTVAGDASVSGTHTVGGNQVVDGTTQLVGDTTFGPARVDDEKSFAQGVKGTKIFWNESGWMVESDYVTVHKRMYVKEVQVDEVTHVGGENLLTDAACVADSVKAFLVTNGEWTEVDPQSENVTFFRVFFRKRNGEGRTVYNHFRIGDQGYCQIFNIDASVMEDFTNKYYWRLVTGTSNKVNGAYQGTAAEVDASEDPLTSYLLDEFHFIDLSNEDCDTNGALRKDVNASSVPEGEDPIVQLGFQPQGGEDAALITERQGATIISGGGAYGRSIRMFEGINSFVLPTPKVLLSPQMVDITANELHIKTTGGQRQTIYEYVDDNTDKYPLFVTGTPDIPTASDSSEPYRSWTAEERVKYSTEPNNAVVLNSDGRRWKFIWDEENQTYAFEEFTDPWLLAQHVTIADILDDNTITADELTSLRQMARQIEEEGTRVEDEMMNAGWETPPANLQRLFDAYQSAYGAITTTLQDLEALTPPIHLTGYTGENTEGTSYNMSRAQWENLVTNYRIALYNWQSGLASWRTSEISEAAASTAMSDAIGYVNGHITDIAAGTIEQAMQRELANYATNSIVTTAGRQLRTELTQEITNQTTALGRSLGNRIGDTEDGLEALGTWLKAVRDANGNILYELGETGLVTELSRMFAGTAYNELETEDGHEVYYDIAGNRYTYSDTTGQPYTYTQTEVEGVVTNTFYDGTGTVIADPHVSPRVTTSGKSGLVTDKNFASMFAERVDADGIAKTASVSTLIHDGIATATILAEQVFIESGSRSMGNYFALDGQTGNVTMHDLFANDITVEGVINNLQQPLTPTTASSGRYGYFDTTLHRLHLDPLAIGSEILVGADYQYGIVLPCAYAQNNDGTGVYIEGNRVVKYLNNAGVETYSSRPYTMNDMRQCVGKKFYLFPETDSHFNVYCTVSIIEERTILAHLEDTATNYDLSSIGTDTPVRTVLRQHNGLEFDGANHYVILECCLGSMNGWECIYWKVQIGVRLLNPTDEEEE